MKGFLGIVIRAVLVALGAAAMGLGVNLISSRSIPYVYVPPTVLEFMGVKVPLIDEKQAYKWLDDQQTVFVDTREDREFAEGRVKGAVKLPAEQKEELFPAVEPLLPEQSRLILYCHGPDCKMAEKVAEFLAQLGYKNMMIMEAGFPAWEKAGYPVENDDGPASGGNN
ncbi:MAG: rhodanese-like domain-containing protein [Thermodesulfobacteriota bacterium]